MSDPTKQEIGWGRVFKINMQFLFGSLMLLLGWLCWQSASLKWWGLWLMAILYFMGGGIQFLQATVAAIRMAPKLRRWKQYEQLGSRPRADQMAQESDFTDGGFGK